MGVVLELRRLRFGHARTSDKRRGVSRAAREASSSASTPADRATAVAVIAAHHSDGIRSRCAHLGIAVDGAPISVAMAPCDDQSEMMLRNELSVDIDSFLGQFVLNGKANVSYDVELGSGHHYPMPKKRPTSEFEKAIIDRTKWARQSLGKKQHEIAKDLGTTQDHYKHWESVRVIPPEFVERFCNVCVVDANWLFTGKGRAPALDRASAEERTPSRPRRPRARRFKAA